MLHHSEMMPQFECAEHLPSEYDFVAAGLTMFTIGLFKKVADRRRRRDVCRTSLFGAAHDGDAITAGRGVDRGARLHLAALFRLFRLFRHGHRARRCCSACDLPINFNSPYKATKHHRFLAALAHDAVARSCATTSISRSAAIGAGPARRYVNLLITMLLGGLWHGAGWTFVIWGALHGFYLVINHAWIDVKKRMRVPLASTRLTRLMATAATFVAVVVGWVFFRADSVASALSILHGMSGLNGFSLDDFADNQLGSPRVFLLGALMCSGIVFFGPNSQSILARIGPRLRESTAIGLVCGILAAICLITLRNIQSDFLYFQF